MSLKGFSIFSSRGHFVQPNINILAYLVEGHRRNISTKLYENWSFGLGADIIQKFFFLFLALEPSYLSEWNDFIYFGREPSRQHSYEV